VKHFATALAAALVWGGAARAEEVNLIFATINPPGAHMNVEFLHPWADKINAEGKGIVHIDLRDGSTVATVLNAYDRLLDDVVQIAFELHNYVNGKFPLSTVATLPLADKGEDRSVALWRLYQSGALDAEYDKAMPLMLFGISQSQLHLAKPITSMAEIAGLKIITPTKIVADAASALGASAISLGSQDIYQGIQRGTAVGAIVGWAAFDSFKLGEVTTYHIDEAMGTSSGMIIMSRARYNSLSPEARKILGANAGEAVSRAYGAWWDHENDRVLAEIKASPKQTVVKLPPDQEMQWKARMQPMIEAWAKASPGGEATLATYKKLLADVGAGK
jgi:TRAP-type C4-dicarboxylate transport system substrate-binding protein